MRFAWGLHEVCTRSAWGLHKVCTKFARGLHEVCTRFARGLHKVCMRFARGWHEVCMRLAWGSTRFDLVPKQNLIGYFPITPFQMLTFNQWLFSKIDLLIIKVPRSALHPFPKSLRHEVARGLHEVCMRFARGLHEVGMRFARGLHEVCTRFARGLHEVCMRSAWGLHEVCMRFAQGLHEVWPSSKTKSDWLFPHHPIPNANFQPMTL